MKQFLEVLLVGVLGIAGLYFMMCGLAAHDGLMMVTVGGVSLVVANLVIDKV